MTFLTKFLVAIGMLPLLGLGLASMFVPSVMYDILGLKTQNIYGINTIRSDIGGMLISSAIMIAIGLWKKNAIWFRAVILVMTTLLFGRIISTIIDGFTADMMIAVIVEIYVIITTYFTIKQIKSSN